MNVTLVGFKSLDFTDREGKQICGTKIFYAYPDANVVGNAVDGCFINENVFESFGISKLKLEDAIGTVIDADFDRKGKIVGIYIDNDDE